MVTNADMARYNALQKLIADRKRREALAAAVRPILASRARGLTLPKGRG